jgi:hypothetical protein
VNLRKENKMQMNLLPVLTLTALMGLSGPSVAAAPADTADVPLTLSGCVIAGEAKDSYLLTNVVIDGTTLAPPNAFYRFNTTEGLKSHVGHRVEVKGKADLDDVDSGKVRIRTEDGTTTTEVTSERRTVKAPDVWFGSAGAVKLDAQVPTYKFSVDSVKRLAGNCANAASAQ